ncbi:MAG TPA: hypothetical protein VK183_08950 [Flavobacterium sp.]|nr:hypothetical protein [Flavobacterium sp.]
MRLFLHKVLHWEYWPFQIVYIPIYFQWAWYALRCRTIFFFNAANPGFRNGGFINESKKDIYDLLPDGSYPKTLWFPERTAVDFIQESLAGNGLRFPLIAKPDMGLRGSAVRKIENEAELAAYAETACFDYLLQELIPYENEVGIFYIRYPHETKGRITGIVAKEFLSVTGDGVATLRTLLARDPRHEMQLPVLEKEYGAMLDEVLPAGKKKVVVPYGNHCRGAKFTDVSHWKTPELEAAIDAVCSKVDGFYFGRMDLMYHSLEALQKGRQFQLVELNGAGSEPTHIYDPRHSLFFAWKELSRHIGHMYRISVENHRKGVPYLTHREGMVEYREHNHRNRLLAEFTV